MIEDYFTQTAYLQRNICVKDGAGGVETGWLSIMTSLGKLDGIGGSTGYYANKMHADSTHVWICDPFELTMIDVETQISFFGAPFFVAPAASLIPTNIDEGDRLLINEIPYRITWLDDPMNFARHLEIELKRWDNDG